METARPAFIAVLALLFACQTATSGDGEHDSFTSEGGAADVFGVEEGSCEAVGLLTVANTASQAVLVDEIGLLPASASNLASHREASGPLQTLEALDAVPWIGPVSFEYLLAHAREAGFVEACERDRRAPSSYDVSLEVSAGGEYFDPDDGDWDCGDWECTRTVSVDHAALPFRFSAGDFDASIGEDGLMRMSYSVGDDDASAGSSVRVPLDGAPGTRYELSLAGGDHASGAWNVDATLTLTLR